MQISGVLVGHVRLPNPAQQSTMQISGGLSGRVRLPNPAQQSTMQVFGGLLGRVRLPKAVHNTPAICWGASVCLVQHRNPEAQNNRYGCVSLLGRVRLPTPEAKIGCYCAFLGDRLFHTRALGSQAPPRKDLAL